MNRKLAVPLAVSRVKNRAIKTRILKDTEDLDDIRVLSTLAENRSRLERLARDVVSDATYFEPEDASSELDYIKASIQLGLLEITSELDKLPSSDEAFEAALA